VCSFILSVLAFSTGHFPDSNNRLQNVRQFLTTPNGVIVLSLCETYGVYIFSSILYLDFWHILTSFPQYTLLMTCYINILDVYAFCNWHDVSLPRKKTVARPKTLYAPDAILPEDFPTQRDVDTIFEKVVKRALMPYKEPKYPKQTDSFDQFTKFTNFRTMLIISWISSYDFILHYF